jgi:hypothetical protein
MMAAIAHQHRGQTEPEYQTSKFRRLVDEPVDREEAEMTPAAFEIIGRAHELCGHPPARACAEPVADAGIPASGLRAISTPDAAAQLEVSIPERREAVRNLTAEDCSTREIADIVGVSHVTVADDVKNLTPLDAVAALAADDSILTVEKAQRDDGHQCPSLEQVATKILRSQIRAGELVREMEARGEFEDIGVTCLVDGADETDEPPVDWKEVAEAAWHSESWAKAAKEYRR